MENYRAKISYVFYSNRIENSNVFQNYSILPMLSWMSKLDKIFCNCGVKNLIANLLLRSTCDIIWLDEAFQPWICIYKSKKEMLFNQQN